MEIIKLNIEPGKKLLLKPDSCFKTNPKLEIAVTLESVTDDGHIVISAPIYKTTYYPLEIEETIHMHYIDLEKNGIAHFQCVVTERLKKKELRYIKARVVSNITMEQRREEYRVKTSLTGVVSIQEQEGEEMQTREYACLCTDISTGGAALHISESELTKGDHITVSLPIGADNREEVLLAEMMWQTDSKREGYQSYFGVMFHFSDKRQPDTVWEYVLRRQLHIIHKSRTQ